MAQHDVSETRRRFVEIIGNCVYHALGLTKTLEEEQRALASQDIDALDAAVCAKAKCVEELRVVEQERKNLCIESGFPDEPEQMQKVIAWCDDYAVVENCWQHLLDVVAQCDSLNMTNGAIIRGRKQHVDSSISIIRGGKSNTGIYNRSGQEPQRHNLRSIAEA